MEPEDHPYSLVLVREPADWQAFHDIREQVLWTERGKSSYQRNHPDDVAPNNFPYMLKFAGRPVGVIRLDLLGNGDAAVRLVAIVGTEQGRGHGRVMARMVEALAVAKGGRRMVVNAAKDAIGFYEGLGYHRQEWGKGELVGPAADCVQMVREVDLFPER